MKNVLFVISLVSSSFAYGQKKKPARAIPPPPIVRKEIAEPPQSLSINDDSKKCFVYVSEVAKDSVVAVTENLLEYFPSGRNARINTTTYQYDSKLKKQSNGSGEMLAQTQQLQFIEGNYTIEKETLTVIPDKKDKFDTRRFKIVYKPDTNTVINLKDEQNHLYKKGKCIEPMISL
ncbi:hypothetical protein [Chryseobacterium caseinilyticum]|uniref:DUF3857 domain-containing protein n=1 Tax=Chryseobacterium caseinilyticum TaxID=2771428 RepID=A0ABR8Z6J6_9FLAO|nr:hypothetical protein [Chryseobacterium caseinilyticum]MBD8080914.1 hypothetical protein [Chryseobacterium caseinilyticum]